MKYLDFLDKKLEDFTDSPQLYIFRRKLAAEMTERANEIVASGINDENVMNDLVISEYEDAAERYADFLKKKKAVRKSVLGINFAFLGALLYVILGFIGIVSWNTGWIMAAAPLLADLVMGIIIAFESSAKKKRKEAVSWKKD